ALRALAIAHRDVHGGEHLEPGVALRGVEIGALEERLGGLPRLAIARVQRHLSDLGERSIGRNVLRGRAEREREDDERGATAEAPHSYECILIFGSSMSDAPRRRAAPPPPAKPSVVSAVRAPAPPPPKRPQSTLPPIPEASAGVVTGAATHP